jgi:hypothetical protein
MTIEAPTREKLEALLAELHQKESTPEVERAIEKIEAQLEELSEAG